MLRIIHAVLRDNATYDPHRYAQVLKAKGVPWALSLPS